jgi:hypothetical protein
MVNENSKNSSITSSPSIAGSQEKTPDYAELHNSGSHTDAPPEPSSGIVRGSTLLMRSSEGEVQAVEATPAKIVPLMVRGWRQVTEEEGTPDVRHADAGNPDLLR